MPSKVLLEVQNRSILEIHLNRLSKSNLIDEILVATTTNPSDDKIIEILVKLGYKFFRGSEDDVLDRYYNAAIEANADIIVRITSDCPLIDPEIIDNIILEHIKYSKDFTSNIIQRTFPDGMDVEVFSFNALKKAWIEANTLQDREHVTYFIWKNSNLMGGELFTAHNVLVDNDQDYSNLRLTLDHPEDFDLITTLIRNIGSNKTWYEYVKELSNNPLLVEINKIHVK